MLKKTLKLWARTCLIATLIGVWPVSPVTARDVIRNVNVATAFGWNKNSYVFAMALVQKIYIIKRVHVFNDLKGL